MNFERKDPMEDVLHTPDMGQELGPDELAIHSAGLTHPNDMELERILAEDWQTIPGHDEDTEAPAELSAEEGTLAEDTSAIQMPLDAPTQVVPVISEIPAEDTLPEDIQPVAEDPVEELYEEDPMAPQQKGRPKRKKGYGLWGIPHIIATAIWLLLTVAIGVSLGRILWVCCADVMAFDKPAVTASIEVTETDDITSVSQKLQEAKLIRYPGLFTKFAEITKKADRIKPGTHELGSHLDYNAMINAMVYVGTAREEVEITFPEGYNCAQVFKLLEENNVCSVEELESWAAEGELKEYWFLEGLNRGDKYCLEGYLAPDTYRFYTNDEPKNVLEKFLNEFDDRFTDIMKDDFANMQSRYENMLKNRGYGSEYIAEHPLTLHQVVTVASIVERETSSDMESYDIASVFYNRVTNPNILNMGSDATVYYAIGDYLHEKEELTQSDLDTDSPYNTRKAQGIPPGPICNPGAYSLYAALDPNDTNYHYFIYDSANSQHLFSTTYDEHMRKANELGD